MLNNFIYSFLLPFLSHICWCANKKDRGWYEMRALTIKSIRMCWDVEYLIFNHFFFLSSCFHFIARRIEIFIGNCSWCNDKIPIERTIKLIFFLSLTLFFFLNMLINFQFMHINTNKQHGSIQRSEYHSIHAANQMVSVFSSEEQETSSRAYHEEATGVNVAPIRWIFFQVVDVLFSLDNCGINHQSSTMSLDTAHWNNELN